MEKFISLVQLVLLFIQHILERGNNQERSQIIKNLRGQVVKMSQHKFASNVIEKCLEYGDAPSRELIICEVVGQNEGNDNLLVSTSQSTVTILFFLLPSLVTDLGHFTQFITFVLFVLLFSSHQPGLRELELNSTAFPLIVQRRFPIDF